MWICIIDQSTISSNFMKTKYVNCLTALVSPASLLRLEQHTEVFGKTCTFMCLFLPSLTDLSHDCWWVIFITPRGERTFLLGTNCSLGITDAHILLHLPQRNTRRLTADLYLFLSLHCVSSQQVFSKHSNGHNNHVLSHLITTTQHRLNSFVMLLEYLYCIPLYVVEFKMKRNPEFAIKSQDLYLFGLNFISCMFAFLFLYLNGMCMHFFGSSLFCKELK